jgi:hypothetical protein
LISALGRRQDVLNNCSETETGRTGLKKAVGTVIKDEGDSAREKVVDEAAMTSDISEITVSMRMKATIRWYKDKDDGEVVCKLLMKYEMY